MNVYINVILFFCLSTCIQCKHHKSKMWDLLFWAILHSAKTSWHLLVNGFLNRHLLFTLHDFFVFLSKHAAAFYRVCQTQYVPVTSIWRRNKKHGSANSFPVLGVRIFYLSTWMEWTWRMLLHELWHLQNMCLRRSGVERGDIWNKMFICVSLIIFICTP